MTYTDAPDDALPELRPLELEAIQLTDEELAVAAERSALEHDPERAWSRYLRCLALTALKNELRRRRVPVVVGPELEPDQPERLLMLDGRCTQMICASPLSDELEVSLANWWEAATAPQLLLAAVVDEDQGVVHFPGVVDAAAFVTLASGQDQQGEMVTVPVAMFQGGIERLERWLLLLDSEALPRVALPAEGRPDAGRLRQQLQDGLRARLGELLEGLLTSPPQQLGILTSLRSPPVPVVSRARSGGVEPIQLLTPSPQAEREGMPAAMVVCSQPTIWTRQALAEIQILEGEKRLWRKVARLREPITTPLPWPLPPLTGGECYTLRLRPWGAPAESFAEVLLLAPPPETLIDGDREVVEGLEQGDFTTWLDSTRPAVALEVMAQVKLREADAG